MSLPILLESLKTKIKAWFYLNKFIQCREADFLIREKRAPSQNDIKNDQQIKIVYKQYRDLKQALIVPDTIPKLLVDSDDEEEVAVIIDDHKSSAATDPSVVKGKIPSPPKTTLTSTPRTLPNVAKPSAIDNLPTPPASKQLPRKPCPQENSSWETLNPILHGHLGFSWTLTPKDDTVVFASIVLLKEFISKYPGSEFIIL
jgi:hypothetical protein